MAGNVKLRYVADHPVSYFLFECPTCGNRFYSGGRALHEPDCSERGYTNCTRIFGDRMIEEVKHMAAKYGDDWEWWGLSLNMLREHFPELADRAISEDGEP